MMSDMLSSPQKRQPLSSSWSSFTHEETVGEVKAQPRGHPSKFSLKVNENSFVFFFNEYKNDSCSLQKKL